MVVGYLSPLLMDWTLAVTELNTSNAHKLLEKEPELLWTPIPHALDDTDHLLNELVELNNLGSSFQPVSAIQFTLLQYREDSQDSIQLDRFKFLTYLIEQSSLHDLDTRFWGECNNSTLHLVCFLGQQKIIQLLILKGVSISPMNGLGFLPKDVASSEFIINALSKVQKKENISRTKSTVVRPNYSTPDRFKLLRDLAEESSVIGDDNIKKVQNVTIERKQSEVHYFRKGRVKETQQKVLIEEGEKQNMKRQLEVAQLVKKSAVKNNPLWKKMEKVTFITSPTLSPSNSSINLSTQPIIEDSLKQEIEEIIVPEIKPKRNSKVISSLQKNSYVSSSIFVQADEPSITTTTRSTRVTKQNNLDNETQSITIYSTEPNEHEDNNNNSIQKSSSDQSSSDEDDCYFEATNNNNNNNIDDSISISSSSNQSETLNHTFAFSSNEDLVVAPLNNHTFSISSNEDLILSKSSSSDDITKPTTILTDDQHEQETYTSSSTHTTSSEDYSDDDENDEYNEATPVQFATRLMSPVYTSVVVMNEEKFEIPTTKTKSDIHYDSSTTSSAHEEISIPVEPTSPVRPQRSDLRKTTVPLTVETESKEKKRMSGSQKATWTMSMSSWAAILDREFNLDELDQQKKVKERQQSLQSEKIEEENITMTTTENRLSTATLNLLGDKLQLSDDEKVELPSLPMSNSLLSLNTTPIRSSSMISFHEVPSSVIKSTPLPTTKNVSKPPQIAELPKLNPSKSISRKPIVASISETNITKKNIINKHIVPSSRTIQVQQRRLQHGKLYLHVNGIQDILLPLPKDRAYVRCVVSDGKFEYMSRYEILSQNINFDYECVIDTHPDMIITISLHVRPDYVMKSKTPFSRLFSSKKKKESLSGYVNKEDGAIGQARFALAHMLPVCVETTYPAEFHCFNAWYSRSFKERHRQKKKDPDQDVLKVVGNFDVAMLYLPIQDLQKPFPRNLRECDAAIKRLHKSVEESSEKYHTF